MAFRFLHSRPFLAALLVLGTLIRIAVFYADRPMDRDEVVLALNVIHGTASTLTEPTFERKGDPAGYLLILQGFKSVFGTTSYALRLCSLLLSIGSLLLFVPLSRRFLERSAQPIALFLFTFSTPAIWFASSTKQYSSDLFMAVLLYLVLPKLATTGTARFLLGWSLVGALSFWISYPSVFILAGFLGSYVPLTLRDRSWKQVARFALPALCWAASFVLCYRISMQDVTGSGEFHQHWFVRAAYPVSPFSIEGIRWYYLHTVFGFMQLGAFYTPLIAAGITLAGLWLTLRRNLLYGLLLSTPAVIVFLASCLELYPLPLGGHPKMGRFIIWLVPATVLLAAEGITGILNQYTPRRLQLLGITLSGFLLAQPAYYAVRELRSPEHLDQITHAFELIAAERGENDLLYAGRSVSWFLLLYGKKFGIDALETIWSKEYGDIALQESEEHNAIKGRNRVWVIVRATARADAVESFLASRGTILRKAQFNNCVVWLFDFSHWQ